MQLVLGNRLTIVLVEPVEALHHTCVRWRHVHSGETTLQRLGVATHFGGAREMLLFLMPSPPATAAGKLLEDVPHRQVVFTIPKRPTIARSCSASREERAMSSPSSTPELATNRSSQLTNRRNSRMLE